MVNKYDNYIMSFGKYKNQKLANVPASYLLWLKEQGKVWGIIKEYIEENLEVLKNEIREEKNSLKYNN